jgi:hypothetical protein
MGGQLARLFLRGSLMSDTAKLLTKSEISMVESLMKEAWDDPALQSQKMEFCLALGRTIGNEYKDIEAGKADALITFWKAALLVLFHESKQCKNQSCKKHHITTHIKIDKCIDCGSDLIIKWSPKPQIAEDPIKRKKFFQAVMFNYLRQIFRENKPPSMKNIQTEDGAATDVATKVITSIIDKLKNVQYTTENTDDDHHIIHCETSLIPLKTIKQIADIKSEFEQHGVQITVDWATIDIVSALEVPPIISYAIINKVYTKFTSLDNSASNDSDYNFKDIYEHKAISIADEKTQQDESDLNESLRVVRSRLSDAAQKLFDVIVDTPDDYINKFKTSKLHKSHLAAYFGVDQKEIDSLKESIKLHCLAVDIGTNDDHV